METQNAKVIKRNSSEILKQVYSGISTQEMEMVGDLYEAARNYEMAQESIASNSEYLTSGLAEIAEGRRCTYNLSQLAIDLEKRIIDRDSAQKTFALLARLGGYTIEE